jgi:hypothetical protein
VHQTGPPRQSPGRDYIGSGRVQVPAVVLPSVRPPSGQRMWTNHSSWPPSQPSTWQVRHVPSLYGACALALLTGRDQPAGSLATGSPSMGGSLHDAGRYGRQTLAARNRTECLARLTVAGLPRPSSSAGGWWHWKASSADGRNLPSGSFWESQGLADWE